MEVAGGGGGGGGGGGDGDVSGDRTAWWTPVRGLRPARVTVLAPPLQHTTEN